MKVEPQFSVLTALSLLLAGLSVLTLVPRAASKPDLLGFHTLCAFAPASTLILLALAGFARAMRDTVYRRDKRN